MSIWFYNRVIYDVPEVPETSIEASMLEIVDKDHYRLGNSWLRKGEDGNWESYIEGSGYDRGRVMGILQAKLQLHQESVFIQEIERQIPSSIFMTILKIGVSWFNRDLDQYIPLEFRQEIFGISEFFPDKYDHIGPKYNRIVNYHAAHDIGHAVQNMRLVGCTVLGEWQFDEQEERMIVGRNFDFYFGEEFAKEKIVLMVNPDNGYKFLSVTWAGFCGVVSGMNEKGLGVTLNSDKSKRPKKSGTPVSIIARQILQYAQTIDEAIVIAGQYTSFVSESFTISSKTDGTIAVIEKTPERMGVYYPQKTTVVVTNHFQSPELKNLPINQEHVIESESLDRYARAKQLLEEVDSMSQIEMVKVLRNKQGINGKNLGLANPKAINQLLAHHAVIFENTKKQVWVSSHPYQEGGFSAYDLDEFQNWTSDRVNFPIDIDSLEIEASSFIHTPQFEQYQRFRALDTRIKTALDHKQEIPERELESYLASNPHYYGTHMLLGDYYQSLGQQQKSIAAYKLALSKDIAYLTDSIHIASEIQNIKL